MNFFLISAIEKGIKNEISDKDTQKEIKQIIGNYKQKIKSYKKSRKEQLKELDIHIASHSTNRDEFKSHSGVMQSALDKHLAETMN